MKNYDYVIEYDPSCVGGTGRKPKKRKPDTDTVFAICVVALLLLAAAANLMHKPRILSEKENRELQMFPNISLANVLDGSFMDNFEAYAADQFIWRDAAVSLKANSERLLGKNGNNGVHFGKDGYLIARPAAFDKANVDRNTEALITLQQTGEYNMTVAVVPTAFEVLRDKLPPFSYDNCIELVENEVTEQLRGSAIRVCDTTDMLRAHKDEYIYYRTDHHQTALGSYYVYSALGEYLGYTPRDTDAYSVSELTDSFYGTAWSKASLTFEKPDTIEQYTLKGVPQSFTVEFPLEGKKLMGLYAKDNLEKKDKYTVYLDGNHGLTVINNPFSQTGRKIAVLKDSYSHSLAPFLASEYDTVYMIDMRYYNDDLVLYLADNGIKDVLVLYDAETFNTDRSLGGVGELALTTSYVKTPPFGPLDEQEPVGDEYFADAVFFGDSITLGHSAYATVPARFVCKSAINTSTVNTDTLSSGRTVMQELLSTPDVGKYYIMFGINEVSYINLDVYKRRYGDIIDNIRAVNPDAIIYIQSVLPVERSVEARKIYNSTIREANAKLAELAVEKGCYYLDVYSCVAGPDGYLPDGSATDGVHFTKEGHMKWEAYLKTHAVDTNKTKKAAAAFSLYTGGGKADIDGIVNDILNSIKFKDSMSAVGDNVAARMFGLEANSAMGGAVYTGGGSTAEEFAVFEAESPEKAKQLAEKLRQRVEDKKPNFVSYKPEEMPKLNNPVIEVRGNLAFMCISDDNAAAEEIINKY